MWGENWRCKGTHRSDRPFWKNLQDGKSHEPGHVPRHFRGYFLYSGNPHTGSGTGPKWRLLTYTTSFTVALTHMRFVPFHVETELSRVMRKEIDIIQEAYMWY
jgi:hypothetical protein